ncbi:type II toxin-antitoxin system VapC family toxin [Meiothermus taiwanensis]|jgi:ribonuclease VapC|uniref:PIN domain-containing protein n=1 Tax=Meiothermus taiwanensis WR-220 TaxID=1339250 RepID=A0ABN5LUI6_9DEIN|nr:type II toxin-antitoxin system VapC family toxin [Meiothermus taiwanensis]AWR85683.1 hypothetical protein Mtai_v1c04350 [Meiothermus taiwanensis WR-220]KIQ53833.1 hypothetical protein SY28_11860 [Meiothermus taiwanensis]KZK16704.1 hypothetical protein A3962_14400 [Meiothermus taiwanensis]
MSVVLDASALLAYLNQEAGAEEVAGQMVGGINAVNLAEVYSKVTEWGLDAHLLEQTLVRQGLLGLEVVPFGPQDVQLVATLQPLTKALGDWVCLALAMRLGLPAVTTDSAWNHLEAGVEVRVVR